MSEIHVEEHSTPIKTPKQLIILLVLAFAVPVTLIVMLVQLVTTSTDVGKNNPAMSDEAIAKRLKPVGEVVVLDPSAPRVEKSGQEVVNEVCAACHVSGALGAPKIGDRKAWSKLAAQGLTRLTQIAIAGIRNMPSHGGHPELTDTELARAITDMVNQSGGNWKEPISRKPAPGAERTGEQIVRAQCGRCHETGVGGAPRIGDRAAWIPRATQGLEVVLRSAIRGHGGMPARGGTADLTDAELRSAIIYMFNAGGAAIKETQAAAPGATQVAAPPAKADAPRGKTVYDANCAACHAAGLAGAPKTGDKTAWAPRLKSGVNSLYTTALKGKGAMPPKGGNASLPDGDVKAAVDYLVSVVK